MIRWITDYLGTSSWDQVGCPTGLRIVDVRDLVDRSGNTPQVIKVKIDEALGWLVQGKKVVVCCDYGFSRSNALAAGILSVHDNIDIDEALRRVSAATGAASIKIEVLSSVREALGYRHSEGERYGGQGRLLITGAYGFIGSALRKHLKESFELVTPKHEEIDLTERAFLLDSLVRKMDVKRIVHLANPRVYTTNESMGAMVVMLKNVLDVCVANNLWLVYPSSWEIYTGYKTIELRAGEELTRTPERHLARLNISVKHLFIATSRNSACGIRFLA